MKRILCFVLSLSLLMVPALAADLDEVDYYSSPVVLSDDASLLDYAVMPLAATSWDTADQAHLAAIRNALTFASTTGDGSVLGWVKYIGQSFQSGIFSDILDEIELVNDAFRLSIPANEGSLIDTVNDLESLVSTGNTFTATGNGYLMQLTKAIDSDTYNIRDMTNEIWSDTDNILNTSQQILSDTDSMSVTLTDIFGLFNDSQRHPYTGFLTGSQGVYNSSPIRSLGYIAVQLSRDARDEFGYRTLYSRIQQLQEVLASDDDLALANSQKSNREEIEDSFLTGSSGDTSLGASDFGALSDVGGTIKDSISLNGQSSISDFTTGLSDANTSGQRWFSEFTKNALDTVSSSASYDLRSDPYNMAGWQERYAWLEGDS